MAVQAKVASTASAMMEMPTAIHSGVLKRSNGRCLLARVADTMGLGPATRPDVC